MASSRRRAVWLLTGGLVVTVGGALAFLLVATAWPVRPAEAEPAPPRQEQVRFSSCGNTLSGTLTLPATPGPHPAVVFINGSGAADRTGYGLAPPLWRHFAGRSFASLSWDRPGVGESTGDFEAQTFPDRAAEAIAAVSFLRSRPDIRADAVGLWGFSQGGIVAPLAASDCADVAFLIEVSGCQTVAWQQDPYRVEAEVRADGFPEADVAEAAAFARRRMDLIRGAGTFEELDEAQQKVRDRPWFEYVHLCDRKRFQSGRITVEFDPGPSWEKVRCPVLAIFGEKDTSCPVEQSVAVVRRGLERAGNADVTLRVFPNAAHGLTVAQTGGPKEARERERQRGKGAEPEFVPGYADMMGDWLAARFGPPH
jgi:pimeloyl-ACP methyl ester carboxylesterase